MTNLITRPRSELDYQSLILPILTASAIQLPWMFPPMQLTKTLVAFPGFNSHSHPILLITTWSLFTPPMFHSNTHEVSVVQLAFAQPFICLRLLSQNKTINDNSRYSPSNKSLPKNHLCPLIVCATVNQFLWLKLYSHFLSTPKDLWWG